MLVVLSGGPQHGSVFDVATPRDVVLAVVPEEPINITSFGSEAVEYMPNFRRAEYRQRRHGCGRPAYALSGEAIYDYRGIY